MTETLGSRADAAIALLRARGERVTSARRAVLQVLESTSDHLDADEISTRAAAAAPGVHRATVYRALATLGELGIVSHTHISGSAAVYHLVLAAPEPVAHAHAQCTSCGAVIDVPVALLEPLAARLLADLQFALEPDHAALLGTCAACRADH